MQRSPPAGNSADSLRLRSIWSTGYWAAMPLELRWPFGTKLGDQVFVVSNEGLDAAASRLSAVHLQRRGPPVSVEDAHGRLLLRGVASHYGHTSRVTIPCERAAPSAARAD